MQFTRSEIKDLVKAWFAVTFVFAIAFWSTGSFLDMLFISAIGVGLGFILHELAHKYVAQRYGIPAYFKSFDKMLWASFFLAILTGFIFIAPGAVMMQHADRVRAGRIAAAGPLTNIILALLFIVLNANIPHRIFAFGAMINAVLALFNMLPFLMLDGKKVWNWDQKTFWVLIIVSGLLVVRTF